MAYRWCTGWVLAAMASHAWANVANDQLMKLPDDQRSGIFAAMLRNGGEKCASASRVFYQGKSSQGDAFWAVSCKGGESWQIMVRNNAKGSTKYLSCKMIAALNAGECFKKF